MKAKKLLVTLMVMAMSVSCIACSDKDTSKGIAKSMLGIEADSAKGEILTEQNNNVDTISINESGIAINTMDDLEQHTNDINDFSIRVLEQALQATCVDWANKMQINYGTYVSPTLRYNEKQFVKEIDMNLKEDKIYKINLEKKYDNSEDASLFYESYEKHMQEKCAEILVSEKDNQGFNKTIGITPSIHVEIEYDLNTNTITIKARELDDEDRKSISSNDDNNINLDNWNPVDIVDVETLFAFAPAGKFDNNILEILIEASELSYDEFVNYFGTSPYEMDNGKQEKDGIVLLESYGDTITLYPEDEKSHKEIHVNSPGSADGLVEIDIKREFESEEEAKMLYDAITEKMSAMDQYRYGKSRTYANYQDNMIAVAYDGKTEVNVVIRDKDK